MARALLPLPNRMRMVDVIVIVCDMRGLLAALPLMDGSVVLGQPRCASPAHPCAGPCLH